MSGPRPRLATDVGCLRGMLRVIRSLAVSAVQSTLIDAQRQVIADTLQELRDTGGAMTLLPPIFQQNSAAGRLLLDAAIAALHPTAG